MERIKARVDELRKNSNEFNTVLEEATSKIEELIRQRNEARSVRPKGSRDKKIRIKVTALPLTKEEMAIFKRYLEEKYIKDVLGEYFSIRKCIFSNKYLIKSYSYSYSIDSDFT